MGDITTRLIFWNVILFAVPYVVFGILGLFGITVYFMDYVSLSSNPADLLWKPWSLITYEFFHAGIFHILFNMLMLNFAGRLFLTFFTQKQYFSLYILGGLFAGIVYILGYMSFPALMHSQATLIGASASVMAILFGTVAYSPLMELRLFLFGNVKLWHIALVLLIIDLVDISVSNTGGHLAHLGGAFFGYLYISQLKNGRDIGAWFTWLVDSISALFSGKKQNTFKKVHRNYTKKPNAPAARIITKDKTQQQIDEILDKISRSGYDSLSKEEKDFLFRAGK
jgi:membrane associated rhomboid family serine protease